MGKATGFLEFERLEEGYAPVAERVKHYKEFVIGLDEGQALAFQVAQRHLFQVSQIFQHLLHQAPQSRLLYLPQ